MIINIQSSCLHHPSLLKASWAYPQLFFVDKLLRNLIPHNIDGCADG